MAHIIESKSSSWGNNPAHWPNGLSDFVKSDWTAELGGWRPKGENWSYLLSDIFGGMPKKVLFIKDSPDNIRKWLLKLKNNAAEKEADYFRANGIDVIGGDPHIEGIRLSRFQARNYIEFLRATKEFAVPLSVAKIDNEVIMSSRVHWRIVSCPDMETLKKETKEVRLILLGLEKGVVPEWKKICWQEEIYRNNYNSGYHFALKYNGVQVGNDDIEYLRSRGVEITMEPGT